LIIQDKVLQIGHGSSINHYDGFTSPINFEKI